LRRDPEVAAASIRRGTFSLPSQKKWLKKWQRSL
jgi:hypothetical protein